MKIVSLKAENIKRLVAVEINPDSNLVEITGKNGHGKTSILDAIYWALCSGNAVQSKPIRDGQDAASIRLDLGDYVVERKFKTKDDGEYTTSITVSNADGVKFQSPQSILDGFVGMLAFDPLEFSRMRPKDQVMALRDLVEGYDFKAAEELNKKEFNERTDINRGIKQLQSVFDTMSIPEDAPEKRIDSEVLQREVQDAIQHNNKVSLAISEWEGKKQSLSLNKTTITQMETSIESLKEELKVRENALQSALDKYQIKEKEIEAFSAPETIDLEPINEKIRNIDRMNAKFSERERYEDMALRIKNEKSKSEALTQSIANRKKEAATAIANSKLPIDGLEINEDEILINGIPFEQISDAQQLSTSIAVAGAMNPKLRVIRVRDGSLLDGDAMQTLKEYAEEHDMQIWLEIVSDGDKPGIVIEDGMVREQPSLEAAE